jgi:uncharacterized membrane-anchored protein
LKNRPVLIPPPTLVIPQRPVLLHSRQPGGAPLVRRDDVFRTRPGVHVQVDAAADGAPRDALRPQQHLLGVGVAEVDAVGKGAVPRGPVVWVRDVRERAGVALGEVPRVKVEGVGAVEVGVGDVADV